ncbi:enoyl-CoA hydratase/isomerase family protein [Pseudonocardia ailaonensis]
MTTPEDLTLSTIELEVHGAVLLATLNRPAVLNAIDQELRRDLHDLVRSVHETDDVRVLVVTGAGRGFCSGGDVGGLTGAGPVSAQNVLLDEFASAGDRALALDRLDKPVIAAVNGIAAGSGMSLALSADLRVGDERTRFRTAFVERALSPDAGMTYTLTRVLGYARAADLILTAREMRAEEAHRVGLLDRLAPGDTCVAAALELAAGIAALPPLAVRASKQVLKRSTDALLEDALRLETAAIVRADRAQKDRLEAVASFRERRPGSYQGN